MFAVEVLNPVVAVKKPKKTTASASQTKLQCVALYDYQANDSEELSFQKDDVITILEDRPEWLLVRIRDMGGPQYYTSTHHKRARMPGWSHPPQGSLNGQTGLVPVTYVAKRVAPAGSESTLADNGSTTGSGLTLNKPGGKGSHSDGQRRIGARNPRIPKFYTCAYVCRPRAAQLWRCTSTRARSRTASYHSRRATPSKSSAAGRRTTRTFGRAGA